MYYGLILLSVVMFGGCFALNDQYRRMRGSSLKASLEASFMGSSVGLAVLFVVCGFRLSLTPFTLAIAVLAAVNRLSFTFCSFKALDTINLSLFSLFSMLGGMMLPFLQGMIFYDEPLTVAKVVCVVLICAALALTVSRGDKKGGGIYYVGIFLLNGMSGVLSKIFTDAPFAKTSAAEYSAWISVCTVTFAGAAWLLFFRRKGNGSRATWRSCGVAGINGGVNETANFLLVMALSHVEASVQYPLVTGGVMIVTTLICFFGERKPSRKELVSVALAFLGMLALFLIPV